MDRQMRITYELAYGEALQIDLRIGTADTEVGQWPDQVEFDTLQNCYIITKRGKANYCNTDEDKRKQGSRFTESKVKEDKSMAMSSFKLSLIIARGWPWLHRA
jgi:hypothetical protein